MLSSSTVERYCQVGKTPNVVTSVRFAYVVVKDARARCDQLLFVTAQRWINPDQSFPRCREASCRESPTFSGIAI